MTGPRSETVHMPFRFAKASGWPARLGRPGIEYIRQPCSQQQRRFEGRDELIPQVDLLDYRADAVLDWVRLRFFTLQPRQAEHVRRVANTALTAHDERSKAFVRAADTRAGRMGREFLLTLQSPRPEALALVLSTLRDWFRDREFVQPVFDIDAVEVSVDFYVKNHETLEAHQASLLRWRMVELLRRHLRVLPQYTEQHLSWPRVVSQKPGAAARRTQRVLAQKPRSWLSCIEDPIKSVGLTRADAVVFHRTKHKPAPIDGTYHVGAKYGPVMVRIMDKVTDERDNARGTFKALRPREQRARIEVTIYNDHDSLGQGIALERFGRVDDFYEFQFQKLRPRIFEFFVPTVRSEGAEPDLGLTRHLEEVEAFQRGGVYSLDRLHRAEQGLLQARREHKLSSENPAPLGHHGYLRSFLDLNHMTDRALRGLTRRWRRKADFWEERGMGLYDS